MIIPCAISELDPSDSEEVWKRLKARIWSPVTFEYIGPTKDELMWYPVQADGPTCNPKHTGKWLLERGITNWWWEDRAVDRPVWRTTIYFKNETDALFFQIGYL